MKQILILISIDGCVIVPSQHLCIATKGPRSRVCEKLFLSSVVPLVVNGGSMGTLTQLPRQASARKLILGYIGTPLDHLSVKSRSTSVFV